MTYQPKPIETSKIALPKELEDLLEHLAENTHDNWAIQRLKDGWTYGPERNDAEKKHPCLVPYKDLPEIEKEYDRVTAMQTLKAIIALGFIIKELEAN